MGVGLAWVLGLGGAESPARAATLNPPSSERGGEPGSFADAFANPALGVTVAPGRYAWIGARLEDARLRLPSAAVTLPLLDRYNNPAVERSGAWRRFWVGRYGPGRATGWERLVWSPHSCDAVPSPGPGLDTSWFSIRPRPLPDPVPSTAPLDLLNRWLVPPEIAPPELLALSPAVECPGWQRRKPVTFFRIDNERDTFPLLECDGSVSPEAIDRLSIIARPPGVPRPTLPLPSEPDPRAATGEWSPGIKLVHPRLVWAIDQIARAYPYRAVYVVSGYRPNSPRSFHHRGRALDIQIVGVPNETTFALCRELTDVACGYYPNDRFVHVDVRAFGTGHPYWVDAAAPGSPAHYLDTWPGVVEGGALLTGGEP